MQMLSQAKKGIKKWSKCQIGSAYLLQVVGGLTFIQSLFMLINIDAFTNFTLPKGNGKTLTVNLD